MERDKLKTFLKQGWMISDITYVECKKMSKISATGDCLRYVNGEGMTAGIDLETPGDLL